MADATKQRALNALSEVADLPPWIEHTRVIRRKTTIDSRVDRDHLHAVMRARHALGLPVWPVTQFTTSATP